MLMRKKKFLVEQKIEFQLARVKNIPISDQNVMGSSQTVHPKFYTENHSC